MGKGKEQEQAPANRELDKSAHTNSDISSDISLVNDDDELENQHHEGLIDDESLISDDEQQQQRRKAVRRSSIGSTVRRSSISSMDHVGAMSRRSSLGSADAGVPKPSPLSLMGADVIRCALSIMSRLIDSIDEKDVNNENEDVKELQRTWMDFVGFWRVQRPLEHCFKKLIDEKFYACDYAVKLNEKRIVLEEYLDDVHESLLELPEDFEDDLENEQPQMPRGVLGNLDAPPPAFDSVKYNFPMFHEECLRYLQAVHDDTSGAMKKMMKRGEPVSRYLQEILLSLTMKQNSQPFPTVTPKQLEEYIAFCTTILQKGNGNSLAFHQTLWWCMVPDQWDLYSVTAIQPNLNTTQWQDLLEAIDIYQEHQQLMEQDYDGQMNIGMPSSGAPVEFVEILPEKKGLARIFSRRRSSGHGGMNL